MRPMNNNCVAPFFPSRMDILHISLLTFGFHYALPCAIELPDKLANRLWGRSRYKTQKCLGPLNRGNIVPRAAVRLIIIRLRPSDHWRRHNNDFPTHQLRFRALVYDDSRPLVAAVRAYLLSLPYLITVRMNE